MVLNNLKPAGSVTIPAATAFLVSVTCLDSWIVFYITGHI